MVREDDVVEIHFACLLVVPREVPVRAVQGVECEPCEVHCQEIEIHPFNTKLTGAYFLSLKLSPSCP